MTSADTLDPALPQDDFWGEGRSPESLIAEIDAGLVEGLRLTVVICAALIGTLIAFAVCFWSPVCLVLAGAVAVFLSVVFAVAGDVLQPLEPI